MRSATSPSSCDVATAPSSTVWSTATNLPQFPTPFAVTASETGSSNMWMPVNNLSVSYAHNAKPVQSQRASMIDFQSTQALHEISRKASQPLFGGSTADRTKQTSSTSFPGVYENNQDMSEAPEELSVPSHGNNTASCGETTESRHKLVAKNPKDCHHRSSPPKRDFLAEARAQIVDETGSDADLPSNYIGTWKGIRYHQPDYSENYACNLEGIHRLACGHWVKPEVPSPCGLNCKTNPNHEIQPFNCAQCRQIIVNIFTTQLTDAEKAKIQQAKSADQEAFAASYMVQYVTRRTNLEANITETVMWILRDGGVYGRTCHASEVPDECKPQPFDEMIAEFIERKARLDAAKIDPLIHHQKHRTSYEHNINNDITGGAMTTGAASGGSSDSGYLSEGNSPSSKKQKRKFTTSEPLPNDSRGHKRKVHNLAILNSSNRIKRVTTGPPVNFVEPTYKMPQTSVIGALMRKRDADADALAPGNGSREFEPNKRVRTAEIVCSHFAIPHFEGEEL